MLQKAAGRDRASSTTESPASTDVSHLTRSRALVFLQDDAGYYLGFSASTLKLISFKIFPAASVTLTVQSPGV
jgi:hypothetical protein